MQFRASASGTQNGETFPNRRSSSVGGGGDSATPGGTEYKQILKDPLKRYKEIVVRV